MSFRALGMLIALADIFRGIGVEPLQPGNVTLLLWLLMGYLVVTAVLALRQPATTWKVARVGSSA